MLSPYRVLDLTDHRGELAAMILGDLGADVIRVEPPLGSTARQQGPFYSDQSTPEDPLSLQFFAFNRNKRSIALELSTDAGREDFFRLVESADFVIESAPGGPLEKAGIGFEDLCNVQSQIVHVQITPYGADGPPCRLGGERPYRGRDGRPGFTTRGSRTRAGSCERAANLEAYGSRSGSRRNGRAPPYAHHRSCSIRRRFSAECNDLDHAQRDGRSRHTRP